MKSSVVTSEIFEPYAQALMSLARSQDLAERIGEDVRSLLEALQNSPELKQFLANPFIKNEDKKAVLRRIVGEEIHPYTRNFLLLLVDRRRLLFLEGILKQYLTLLRELKQTVLAEVTSARELNEGQKQAVREKIQAITGAASVELETKIDPDIIGGVIIKIGSQIIDASLRGQLRRIGLRLGAV
ncbi:MAG: ATP synthase F1 subunit delta [Oscillatoriaceae bacterium SKW80]|nr:ATP synthase F1 subunit delta [Oscillatoriaceae bacterium SKYG93]MCX8120625.1 ATP synthase F1 subunit delta [Oscillatoriaceae bacterium SKW80]MDW8453836.1 ATP synthase F1 subunit delta [Oscillatoriaceae cyanobacterium SKYGB_i_bin93]HIK27067.1 F0F1 ATP synthase subunit delta [Oscillatoriaceae cyanobacterium M7585_C2015_266]